MPSILGEGVSSFAAPQNPIQRIRRLIDQRLRVVWERMEILERQISLVSHLVQRLHDRRPVGCAVQQGPERLQGVVRPLLGELLEVDVLDPRAEDGYQCSGYWKSMMLPV